MTHGDFTDLAADYARYRPGYAPSVAAAIVSLLARPVPGIDAADIGAGTGIWTVMLAAQGLRSVVAAEPNDEMRRQGMLATAGMKISWCKGSGEATGLAP